MAYQKGALAMLIKHRIVIGIGFLIGSIVGQAADAQPRHGRRHPPVPPTVLVVAPSAQVAQPACSTEDAAIARQHRQTALDAYEVHDWTLCATEAGIAQTHCPTPEAAFNLAYCLENSGQLSQAIEQYELLLQSDRLPAEVTPAQLRRTIESVRARLPRVVIPIAPPLLVCTAPLEACGTSCVNRTTDTAHCGACNQHCDTGSTCTNGACHTVVVAPPFVPVPQPRRGVPLAMIVSGSTLVLTGGVFLGIGLAARSAASTDDLVLIRSGCDLTPRPMQCANYAAGATTPADVASWTVPLGGTLIGIGMLDAIIGTVWYLRTGRTNPDRPHLTGWYAPEGVGISLVSSF